MREYIPLTGCEPKTNKYNDAHIAMDSLNLNIN